MPTTPMPDTRDAVLLTRLLTMEQVAGILGCSTKTVRRLTRAGKLQYMLLDKRELRFRPEWVDAFIDRHAATGAAPDPLTDRQVRRNPPPPAPHRAGRATKRQ